MILFFGPAGAGKSVQGQLLAARHGWRWLSAGQLLRDSHDPDLLKEMTTGRMIDNDQIDAIVDEAIERAKDIDHIILDGFPRTFEQAKWLVDNLPKHERSIPAVIVLDVPTEELKKRLALRGRADDTPEAIENRMQSYQREMDPILGYLSEQGIRVAHIDGHASVGQVHDRIEAEIEACSLA